MMKNSTLLLRAKRLRKDSTKAENLIWNIVRANQLGYKFKRQFPYGEYILDFYCDKLKLCIEIDGEHHSLEKQKIYDEKRSEHLRRNGIKIFRLWNDEVLKSEEVFQYLEIILKKRIKELHLSSSGLPYHYAKASRHRFGRLELLPSRGDFHTKQSTEIPYPSGSFPLHQDFAGQALSPELYGMTKLI